MPKSFWVLLWICIHIWLHLFQTWPLLVSRVWTKDEQQNSQHSMWPPEPGMGNFARPAATPNFISHTASGSYHSINILICPPWQEEKCLESFTSEQRKRWSTSNPFWDWRFPIHLQMKAQLASRGWAGAPLHHLSTAHGPARLRNYGKRRRLTA